jgi:type III pantothenate kinase
MTQADYLLIDVGNGRTKLALASTEHILARQEVASKPLEPAALQAALADWSWQQVIFCSVVPDASAVLRAYFGPQLMELRHDQPMGIRIRYPKPASIGADRLANAVALVAKYGAPGVVIDFGTAVTFDIVAADAHYIGGVIAPGLRLMTDYLHERTALLPKVELMEPRVAIGQSTVEAIQAGAALGYRGMVRGILAAVLQELPDSAQAAVVATGGDAEWIVSGMSEVQAVDPDLTLHGLLLTANLRTLSPAAP